MNSFKNLIESVKNFNIGTIFEQFKQVLKDLPRKIVNFPKIGNRILGVIKRYSDMPPVVEKVKDVIERVRNLFMDVKNDVTEFYEVTPELEYYVV